jgi:NAD(P)-dependent dehydrogenase (short-subunit alcohol dehydrogenase family)
MKTTKAEPEGPDRFRLDGQVAIVTGGGGGIGFGVSMALARFGATVVIGDVIPERCAEAADQIIAAGGSALGVPTDVMDTDQVRNLAERAMTTYGRVDVLVNNVGGVRGKLFLDQSERSWRRHIDINLVSVLAATSAVAPLMIAGGRGGSIINVASMEATRAAPFFSVYAACKAAMVSFTRTMSLELAEHGIRVNAIAPDHTITPGNRGNRSGPVDESIWKHPSAEETDAMNRAIPMGREGDVDECGDVVVFLASAMSRYVTGTLLPVDGGTWASSGWVRDSNGRWTLNEGVHISSMPAR